MERAKVREVDNIRFLFLIRLFLEYFLALREYEISQGVDMTTEDGHDFDLIAEATDPASIVYVCLRMKAAQEDQVRRGSGWMPTRARMDANGAPHT